MSLSFLDDVEPVPPAPKPAPAAPAAPAVVPPPRAAPAPSRFPSHIPQSVLDSIAVDLSTDHPGTRWYVWLHPVGIEVAIAVEVLDRLTNEVVGKAKGAVSLLPLYAGKNIDIASEAERMINSIPSPL
jgi:hypothetical protein